MPIPNDCSWTVRKLMNLRNLGQNFVKHSIGNGQATFIWLDNWHPNGPLYKLFDDRSFSRLGSSLYDKASSYIVNGEWHWPRAKNKTIQQIQASTPTLTLGDGDDLITWSISSTGLYSTKHTWEAIRNKSPKVRWSSFVWYSQNVPKWAFILWVACLKRLATRDRLKRWGMQIDSLCILCSQTEESAAHLFFDCHFSRQIWESVLNKFQIHGPASKWEDELDWALNFSKGTVFRALSFKLAFAAGVYFIWLERNSRVFGGGS
ncbi:hypothetical protein RHMOL_Rhmol11G0252300 [Rhododendron molle]|uniref:Uncharacterized protein n=1 Tax=Rhododendron molle TaxID=49168 RepID=A0ACC0LX52_RHOML|nr:hypothetical protein RHMOL_Rhmol11G0252300 [Rhododendron molle]